MRELMRGKRRGRTVKWAKGLKVEVVCEKGGLVEVKGWMRRQVTFST